MNTYVVPYSGRLLISHLAAYGLAFALTTDDHETFVSHDPDSLELAPVVSTSADLNQVLAAIRASAEGCQMAVEADIEPGRSGNARVPVIRARATNPDAAIVSLTLRESLLDALEAQAADTATALICGLGMPAPWLQDNGKSVPHRGASELDGVPVNFPADIVRSVLRKALPVAAQVTESDLQCWIVPMAESPDVEDKFGWSPAGTKVHWLAQWLAALGICVLPVGLRAGSRARTPGFWRNQDSRGLTLPVFTVPTSIPRLRAILQLASLPTHAPTTLVRAQLKALGIDELVTFTVSDRSTPQMVQFSFERGVRVPL